MLEIWGPGHDGNGIGLRVGIVMVSPGSELFFFPSSWYSVVFRI